jgi:hypothetical protein
MAGYNREQVRLYMRRYCHTQPEYHEIGLACERRRRAPECG